MCTKSARGSIGRALKKESGPAHTGKELAEKLGEYASLAFECDAHKCGKTVLAALEQLSKDPLEARLAHVSGRESWSLWS